MSNGLNGGTCTEEELALGVYCLTRQQNVGLIVRSLLVGPWVYHLTTIFQVVALSGFVSLSAVVVIFALIAVSSCESSSDLWASETHSSVEERHLHSNICCGWCRDSFNRKWIFCSQRWCSCSWGWEEESPFDRRTLGFVLGEFIIISLHHSMFLGFQKLSLFLGSLFQALGVVLEVKWINDGKVHAGSFCTAQGFSILSHHWVGLKMLHVGVFQNLGQSAVAIQTTVRISHDLWFLRPTILMREGLQIITLHTFATIWWQRGVVKLSTAWILVGTLWLFLSLFIAISASVHDTPPFYYPTPVWHCPR